MKYTDNLNLKKPEQTEFYDVDDFNYNADVLDAEVKSIKDGYLPLTGGTMLDSIYTKTNGGPAIEQENGAGLYLFDMNNETYLGGFLLRAFTKYGVTLDLLGKSDGTLKWNGYNIYHSNNIAPVINELKVLISENTFRNKALASALVNVITRLYVEVFADTVDVDTSKGDGATVISKYFDANKHIFNKTDSGTVTIYSKAKTVSTGNNTAWVYGDYTLNGGSIEFAVSRDGGTTYTVLTHNRTIDISSQPAGTSMIMRVTMTGAVVFNNIAWGCK